MDSRLRGNDKEVKFATSQFLVLCSRRLRIQILTPPLDCLQPAGLPIAHDSALVGAYWLQVCQGRDSFASQEVNDLLKHQGKPVANITSAFNKLREGKTRLVHQLQKSGKSKQARKTMKVTLEGIRRVEKMLKGEAD